MNERMLWEDIQKIYPDQWVGLVDMEYVDNDGITVKSAIVKYSGKTQDELAMLCIEESFKTGLIMHHTNEKGHMQMGVMF